VTADPITPPIPFATRATLLAWLSEQGLAHVARFNVEVLAPRLAPDLWPDLRAVGPRRRLIDLADADTLARSVDWLPPSPFRDALLPLVALFVDDELESAASARAALPALLQPPDDPRARTVHARLCELRTRLPDSVAPRPPQALSPDALRFDPALPGFRFRDPRPFETLPRSTGAFTAVDSRLSFAAAPPEAACTCGPNPCIHVLAAIDAALLWLRGPPCAKHAEALDKLARPTWERTILALDQALDETPTARSGVALAWRVHVVNDVTVEITPWIQKLGKKGQLGVPARIGRRHLLLEHGPKLAPEDARIAALLPENEGPATRALLEALLDHPRVVVRDAPERAVHVDRAPLGLVADERHGTVRVSAGIEGTALPKALADRARKARAEEALFLWDGQRLTLLDVKPELKTLLDVLARDGNVFPPESRPALLEALSRWALRLPITMPRSVMGELVPAQIRLVLRLEAQADGSVEMEVRVKPLPDSPSLVPGQGPRDVHVRRGEQAAHAVRDLKSEEAAAKALCAELPLLHAEALDEPLHYRFETAGAALDLLAAGEKLTQPPLLEFIGPQLRSLGAHGPPALKVVIQRRGEWFGVLGTLNVSGERVELAVLLDAVRRNERYVKVEAHSYVEIEGALRRHLERLADHTHASRLGLSVGPSAAVILHELERSGASVDADDGFRSLAARITAARDLSPALPAGLQATLRPYQIEGFQWLSRLAAWGAGGVLADDMGLGKTVQTLAVLLSRADLGPALVLAPTSVAFNWNDEAARFAPSLRLTLYVDVDDRAETLARLGPGDVLVVSYGLLARDAARLASRRFATLVFDEAQSLKNATTQRAAAARGLKADFKLALSGTPIENHTGELWSLFESVFPALLGGWAAFRDRYATPIEKEIDPAAAPALSRVLAPFLLRRTKAEVETELPEKTEVRVPVVLSGAEWQLYEDARLSALSDLETSRSKLKAQQRRIEVLAALTRLRLLASHPRLYDPRSQLASSKLTRLLELVDELRAEGQRALVFSQFTSHLALVREALDARAIEYVYLDGQTPQGARRERVTSFQEGRAPLFLISLKAGGVGLNLTAATNVIHLDPWWNPAVEDQASDRAHRPGQTRPVTIYRLVALGTIEEKMLALHAQKRALVAKILDGKGEAATLSTDELLSLLSGLSGRG
jgi:superfamily II DNA or RNA helicase